MDKENDLRQRIIGLGEHSFKKSYYPELQKNISELNLFKAAFDQVHDMILIINPKDGFLEFINNSAKEFFKVELKHPNLYLADIISQKYWETIRKRIQLKDQSLAAQSFKYKIELEDDIYFIGNSVNPIESNNKKYCVLVIRDITQNINIEKTLLEAKRKAEEGTRLKSAFLANMSHEIRTPMNGILGFVSLLDEGNVKPETRKYYMEIIKSSCDDLLRIIDDVLDISKIESGLVSLHKQPFSLNQVLENLNQVYLHKLVALNKDVSLELDRDLPDGLDVVCGDELRIKQILRNLIDNAVKFTSQGSIIVSYKKQKSSIRFSITDTGIGIKDDNLHLIFERFRQSDENVNRFFGGTGLGLSICKGLLNIMGGSIGVESEYGIGSTFYFEVPLETR